MPDLDPMTVKQLKHFLDTLPDNTPVWTDFGPVVQIVCDYGDTRHLAAVGDEQLAVKRVTLITP